MTALILRFFCCLAFFLCAAGVLAQDKLFPVPATNIASQREINELRWNRQWQQQLDSSAHPLSVRERRSEKVRHRESKPLPLPTTPAGFGQRFVAPAMTRTSSATCYDTSSRFFIGNGSYRLYSQEPCKTADGNFLLPGGYVEKDPPYLSGGLLLKCDAYGNTIWARRYDSTGHIGTSLLNYHRVVELQDGSIVMAGRTNNLITGNDDLILTKTDNNGFIKWSKVYKARIWGPGNGSHSSYFLEALKQDPYSGDLFISGGFWEAGKSMMRIRQSDGIIEWSNLYQYYNNNYQVFDRSFGFTFEPNEIRLFGRMTLGSTVLSVHRLNKTTGDTLSAKLFSLDDPVGRKLEFLSCENVTVLNNGNYVLSGQVYDDYPLNYDPPTRPLHHVAVCELDKNLNFVRAFSLKSQIQSNVYDTRVTVFPDGSGLFTMVERLAPYNDKAYFVQFKDGFITRQRKKTYTGEGVAVDNNALRLKDGGDLLIRPVVDEQSAGSRIEFLKLHTSDTSSACLGVDDRSTSTYSFRYVPTFWPPDSIGHNVFQENPTKTITAAAFETKLSPGCFQVSHCDSLRLVAPVTTICLGQDLSIVARKNEDCGTLVPFRFDFRVADAVRDNDSTLRLQFKTPWSGYIYGSLQGCNLIEDSIHVTVLQSPAKLDLGVEKTICPGNTILLNARKGYATYQWQDGSTDSTFTVTQPGQYHVTTTDACGGTYHDTIVITAAPPIPFSVGPDRTKCNSDTVRLSAPDGFFHYTWTNNYNISSTTAQTVTVSPLQDTDYYIRAEKTPGCFAYDTVRVKVFHSPAIHLGADKSFCSGDSAVFNAGSGFATYLWSNGQKSASLVVKAAGTYSVTATTADGCESSDTVQVLPVFALPRPQLDKNSALCLGDSRVLNPGNFAAYQWSTGSTGPSITVNTTGSYAVTVTDGNGCQGSDTTRITTILPLPSGFLPPDTAICSYGSLELKPSSDFNRYTWSNGAVVKSITVTQPGRYWLEVTDSRGCRGKDTVLVQPKECLNGFYVPTAFTPNGDGKNDIFRPLLFGPVKQYRFTVYNRWGEVVYQTTEHQKGWNGKVAGVLQDNSVFVWTCTYQMEGDAIKTEKGTVMLIR